MPHPIITSILTHSHLVAKQQTNKCLSACYINPHTHTHTHTHTHRGTIGVGIWAEVELNRSLNNVVDTVQDVDNLFSMLGQNVSTQLSMF